MKEFCILHLSDLHIDSIEDSNFILLREELKSDIKKVAAQNNFGINIIAVTGDIVNKGKMEAYSLAKDMFQDILKELSLNKANVVFVPGNHDVPRDIEIKSKLEDCKEEMDNIGFLTSKWNNFNTRFDKYNEFVKQFYGDNIELENGSFGIKDFTLGDTKVRFILFNTAWMTNGDQDFGNIRIGRGHLEYLRQANGILGENDLCIGMIHHPLDWFLPEEKKMIEDYLMNKNKIGIDIILHGHTHDAKIEFSANPDKSIVKLVSGIGYPDACNRQNGQPKISNCRYSIYKFKLEENIIEILCRISNTQGVFTPDNELYRCETEDGIYKIPIRMKDYNQQQIIPSNKGEVIQLNEGNGLTKCNDTSLSTDGLWSTPNGLRLPKVIDTRQLLEMGQQLRLREIKSYNVNYELENFEIVAESVWERAVIILREKILGFGENFVAEMVGVEDLRYVNQLPTFEVINIATELGFIDKTGKMRLNQANEIVQHYKSRDVDSEMPENELSTVVRASVQYILGYDDTHMNFEYGNFREELKTSIIGETAETLNILKGGPYFYKKTTVRTLINLLNETKAGEFDIVVANMVSVFTTIWEELISDDKFFIGITYAQYVNKGDTRLIQPLKSILMKVHGFDYVPENLRSFTFIEAGKRVIEAHYSYDNFYKEPGAIRNLEKLGSVIPKPALKTCITATLMVKLGNRYGVSGHAQETANIILDKMQKDDWKYYLGHCLPYETDLLHKIHSEDKPIENWIGIVSRYKLYEIELVNKEMEKIVKYAQERKRSAMSSVARNLINSIK